MVRRRHQPGFNSENLGLFTPSTLASQTTVQNLTSCKKKPRPSSDVGEEEREGEMMKKSLVNTDLT